MTNAILSLANVSKDFGGLRAVDDVTLDVEGGRILGIVGPNGAGKSTLFNLISGVYHPTRGHIRYKGSLIDRLKPHQVCKAGIGRTFQLGESFKSLTVLECVSLAACSRSSLKDARKEAWVLLDGFGLGGKATWSCENLTPVDIKLLEVCKALATRPQLVLLDEIMSALTRVEAEVVLDQIRKLPAKGITPIVIEHGMHLIKAICEKVVVLNFGRLIASGTPDEVYNDKSVIDSYLGEELDYA